jgi:molybdopterin-guanine dinucleotide biosynthesis protein A
VSGAAAVLGLVLAGGRATRMGGGDKCLLPLAGRPILGHILERLAPQVARIVLNANGDPARFAAFGLPVVPDAVAEHPGPLAGVLTGLEWARDQAPDLRWVVTVPGDGPFLPRDLVARFLAAAAGGAELVAASSGGNSNPVIGLWPVALAGELRRALVEEGLRKVDRWTARHRLATVDWPAEPLDPFFNANTPDELAEAELLLRQT